MAVHTFTLTITNPDAWPPGGPQSNPPLYKFEFDGSPNHVQKFGHIWLGPLGKPLTIEWKIDPASNFVFQPNAAGDGTSALFISNDPAAKLQFNGLGVFSNPRLEANNTKLLVDYQYPGPGGAGGAPVVYYYRLNVIDQNQNVPVFVDPIIVDQP
jgi:hypothetical protein